MNSIEWIWTIRLYPERWRDASKLKSLDLTNMVLFDTNNIFLGVVKKDDFIEETEKTAADLFGQYKKYYVDGDKTDEMDEKTAIAINAGQFTFECCG